MVIPTIFQEELTTFREILIKPGWYKITVCLDGYCLVGEWLSEQTQWLDDLRSSNGSFSYGGTIKWWLDCTSAVSEQLAPMISRNWMSSTAQIVASNTIGVTQSSYLVLNLFFIRNVFIRRFSIGFINSFFIRLIRGNF